MKQKKHAQMYNMKQKKHAQMYNMKQKKHAQMYNMKQKKHVKCITWNPQNMDKKEQFKYKQCYQML
jgi:hypothetical protein